MRRTRYKNFTLNIIFFSLFIPCSFSQVYSRIEADFSIKEKFHDGTQKLTMGRLYYDKNVKKLFYYITFPEKEYVIFDDTTITFIQGDSSSVKKNNNYISSSIFNLCLNGELAFFGLKNSSYELSSIEESDSLIVTTWLLPKKINVQVNKMVLAQKEKKLYGLVTYDKNDEILSKQFFEEYKNIDGLLFPAKVVQMISNNDIIVSTYSNLKINNMGNEKFYNYSPSVN